jgi:hypothetical protein
MSAVRRHPMLDRTTKILAILIATGIWTNVLLNPPLRVASAQQQDCTATNLATIATAISNIDRGICGNPKICGN